MPEHVHSTALPNHVHADELRTIQARRLAAGIEGPPVDRDLPDESVGAEEGATLPPGTPSTRRGLIGLAISGGGIRSSTFSLGVVQALAHAGIFKAFDYISTVSGGGYTGSMLSSLLRDPPKEGAGFPLDKPLGREEPIALQHLRNGSNYLSPGGLLNTMRLPAVVVRGLLLNALLQLPFLMLAVFATEIFHEKQFVFRQILGTIFEAGQTFFGIPYVGPIVTFTALWFLYRGIRRADLGPWVQRNRHELGFAVILLGLAVVAVIIVVEPVISRAITMPYTAVEEWLQEHLRWHILLLATGIGTSAYLLIHASRKLSDVVGKVLFYGAALAGPGLLFGAYLLMLMAQVDSPFMQGQIDELRAPENLAGREFVADTTLMASDTLRHQLADKGVVYSSAMVTATVGDSVAPVRATYCTDTGPGAWAVGSDGAPRRPRPAWHLLLPDASPDSISARELCLLANGDVEDGSSATWIRLAPLTTALGSPGRKYTYEVWGAKLHWGGEPTEHSALWDYTFLSATLLLLLFNTAFLDVNMSSLHRFYRDRLSRLYLFTVANDEGTELNDDQKLHDLNREGSVAPYHIVNATLNLQGDTIESTRGRASDFFMFSKHWTGGPHTGYCSTKRLEELDPKFNLGTAMAISAAAAAPNMGATTKRSMVFILTLLNFRLGYWLPNPRWVNSGKKPLWRWTIRPGFLRLKDEALGNLTAKKAMVNVSDGGHLENLATFELLRRRCRLIVLIDGEADPDLTFHGLVTLMRIAKIDLGVTIRMRALEDIEWQTEAPVETGKKGQAPALTPLKQKVTKRHFAIGEIEYGNGETGCLIYVKSSFTGDENPYVQKYRADNPDFPHETTADQFFDEIQFEAYRSLGHHVGTDVRSEIGSDLGTYVDSIIRDFERGVLDDQLTRS